MGRRTRKFIGASAMLAFVSAYALCAMVLSETRPVHDASPLVQTIYFAVVGLAWILPLMPLIAWMERPDPEGRGNSLGSIGGFHSPGWRGRRLRTGRFTSKKLPD